MLASLLNVSQSKIATVSNSILQNEKIDQKDSKFLRFLKSFLKKPNVEKETNLVKILSEDVSINQIKKEDLFTINEIVNKSAQQIATVIGRCNSIYSDVVESIGLRDLEKLESSKIALDELNDEVAHLTDNVDCFLKNLSANSIEASRFYVFILSYLHDLIQAIKYILAYSFFYVRHKLPLKFNQIRDLKSIEIQIQNLFNNIEMAFKDKKFEKIDAILVEKALMLENISRLIQKQIMRSRSTSAHYKNSKLYFSLLLKTNDLIISTTDLLLLFKVFTPNFKKR
jgi:hypothetical protein